MSFDAGHALCLCKCHEFILEMLIAFCHHEAYIHDRTVLNCCCTLEERVAVDFCIKKRSLFLIYLIYCLYSTDALEPFQCLVHHIDREYRRCVEH